MPGYRVVCRLLAHVEPIKGKNAICMIEMKRGYFPPRERCPNFQFLNFPLKMWKNNKSASFEVYIILYSCYMIIYRMSHGITGVDRDWKIVPDGIGIKMKSGTGIRAIPTGATPVGIFKNIYCCFLSLKQNHNDFFYLLTYEYLRLTYSYEYISTV